jgi:hypothetical protein
MLETPNKSLDASRTSGFLIDNLRVKKRRKVESISAMAQPNKALQLTARWRVSQVAFFL